MAEKKKQSKRAADRKRRQSVTDLERQFLAQAERMYIRERMNKNDIAETLGISARTVDRWREKHSWDQRLQDWETSATGIAEKTMKMLNEYLQGVDKLDTSVTDTVVKTVAAIKKLDSDVDVLGTTLMVVQDMTFFLRSNHPVVFEKLQEVLPDFLMYMREKYRRQ